KHIVTLFRGKEGPLLPDVPRLPTGFTLRRRLVPRRLGVRMFGTGWQRGVAWRLVPTRFQLLNPGQEQANEGLRFRSLASNQFFRDRQCHARDCGENPVAGQSDSPKSSPRLVADYPDGREFLLFGKWDQSRRIGKVVAGRTTDGTLRLANEMVDEDVLRKCRLVPKGEEPWMMAP